MFPWKFTHGKKKDVEDVKDDKEEVVENTFFTLFRFFSFLKAHQLEYKIKLF